MKLNTIFFDLDSTLYPESCGLWQAIRERIDQYLELRMGFPIEQIPTMRQEFLIKHGTTLRGLQIHYDIDPIDYLKYVHDLPLKNYLRPDPYLRKMLLSIPHRRWVFTNSDAPHANRVMKILGITDCFEGMVDVLAMHPLCKPQPAAYTFALEHAGVRNPDTCALIDDSIRNLTTAHDMGFFTVLIGQNGQHENVDRSLTNLHDLPQVIPEFWT